MVEKKKRTNMATARFGSGRGNTMRIEFFEVDSNIKKIDIHLVRIYNDGTTILSVIKLKIEDKNYYYTSITREGIGSSPARDGHYYGYLLVWLVKDSKWEVDSEDNKNRIQTMFKKLKKFDTRLPEEFQKGGETNTGHVGLRIFQKDIKGSKKIVKGGSRLFHVGYHYHHTLGCELLGETAKFYKGINTAQKDKEKEIEDLYIIKNTGEGNLNFINNILKVYESNVDSDEQATIEIDIKVEFNIIENLTQTKEIIPEDIYNMLYPKLEAISIKSMGIKKTKLKY